MPSGRFVTGAIEMRRMGHKAALRKMQDFPRKAVALCRYLLEGAPPAAVKTGKREKRTELSRSDLSN